jgi:hypothetical protein
MYVLMNTQGQYWDGLGWDTDIGEAERYPTEEASDEDAFTILEEWGVAAHAVETGDDEDDGTD